jgi:hypothetical protein
MNVRAPDEIAARNLQQPLAIEVQAVKAKGYEPICCSQNLYVVESSPVGKFDKVKKRC